MPLVKFLHTVVGGRLVLTDPAAETEVSKLEWRWTAGEARRLPEASFRWGLDRLGPPRPPIGETFRPQVPAGHAGAFAVPHIAHVARQEQLLRIQDARQVYEERPARFLGARGTVWVVDGQRIFVGDEDRFVQEAIQERLAQGEVEGPPPPGPRVEAPGPVTIFRVLPVGDTR